MDIRNYLSKYRKQNKKLINKTKCLDYLNSRYKIYDVYCIKLLKICKNYSFNFESCLFNPDTIILIIKPQGLILYGSLDNMKNINLVKTFIQNNFSEKCQSIKIRDNNGIMCESCKFITTEFCCDQLFYKDQLLIDVLMEPN